jgi:hypothetical protein
MTTKISMTARGAARAGLQPLARRFQHWRATRRRGQRIPEELWQAATNLARLHGLPPTVAALKLNYYDLQRRLQSVRPRCRRPATAPLFVELPPVPLAAGRDERSTVEVVQAGGARLILRWPEVGPAGFLPLVRLFLQHGR